MAATTITREKEARTWSILLATPLEDWQVIRGKIIAVLWRNAPAWLVLAFNSATFFFFMRLFAPKVGWPRSPQVILYIFIGLSSIVATVALLAGSGIYFSVRLKSSTAAVMATIGATLGLFVLQRFVVPILMSIAGGARFRTTQLVMMVAYCVPLVLYVAAGLFLIWRAKCLLRQNIF
jgi:ABC-type transport system involved in multi-copper enzyme maturation permease subunit